MTRIDAREIAMRLCFGLSENPVPPEEFLEDFFEPVYYAGLKEEDEIFSEYPDSIQRKYVEKLVTGISEHSAELDGYIEKYAVGWKFSRISRTAAAVMKLAMYEVLYMPDVPHAAAINAAVELAKRYDEPDTVKFVNGVLGSFSRAELPVAAKSPEVAI